MEFYSWEFLKTIPELNRVMIKMYLHVTKKTFARKLIILKPEELVSRILYQTFWTGYFYIRKLESHLFVRSPVCLMRQALIHRLQHNPLFLGLWELSSLPVYHPHRLSCMFNLQELGSLPVNQPLDYHVCSTYRS